jgi:predicted GIY-YIG superfamily endonuclease
MESKLRFVYIIKNAAQPPRHYTGLTSDPVERLKAHNQRNGHHTSGQLSADTVFAGRLL